MSSLKDLLKFLQIFTHQVFAYPFQSEGEEEKQKRHLRREVLLPFPFCEALCRRDAGREGYPGTEAPVSWRAPPLHAACPGCCGGQRGTAGTAPAASIGGLAPLPAPEHPPAPGRAGAVAGPREATGWQHVPSRDRRPAGHRPHGRAAGGGEGAGKAKVSVLLRQSPP